MRGEKCIVVSPNNPATEIAISRYNVYLTSFHDKTCNRCLRSLYHLLVVTSLRRCSCI